MSAQPSSDPQNTPRLHVAPGPHLVDPALHTRRMMWDVVVALVPLMAVALWVFRLYALKQLVLCGLFALLAEAVFAAMRGHRPTLRDGSGLVTGLILGLSLPATAPWFVSLIGSFAAIGIGKAAFGGLGQNLFNPAMVGRAFVMIAFPALLGASAYVDPDSAVAAVTGATPLTSLQQAGESTPILKLLIGNTNGSLGETSALACLLGGAYLCARRTASWELPAGAGVAVAAIALLRQFGDAPWGPLQHLSGGAFLFGAFFIITDPVSTPLTPKGKWIFGLGFGAFVMLLRSLSGYPEGVMFAVLLMNALTPLINRWTKPVPVGGACP
ncbi:RnfABCDGE type electron transport complex subunit D [Kiritimatiella glycovorans]|uniref:Ion-translocating oxidoreductase complex subunit D n=1 Tax=Kiritimatiella glycovorans TaxID=1307763 RepID=A0A0G3EHY2_9BACT|nr:RnfABCDGE type electron transport complex subunit D [Kiritimatiella glycovorans]AKJ64415.1 Nitrogen fixation protein RnfD [Kiritimatiella glycovorans]